MAARRRAVAAPSDAEQLSERHESRIGLLVPTVVIVYLRQWLCLRRVLGAKSCSAARARRIRVVRRGVLILRERS